MSSIGLLAPFEDWYGLLEPDSNRVDWCSFKCRLYTTFPLWSTGNGSAGDAMSLQYFHGLLAEVYTTKNQINLNQILLK